jgi:hypothetical protein
MTTTWPPAELNGRPVLVPDELEEDVNLYETALIDAAREYGAEAFTHIHNRLTADDLFFSLGKTLFKDTVWSRIEWSRSLGFPGGPMHRGFEVELKFNILKANIGPDGHVINESRWVDSWPAPTLWDGPHDDENYRVSMMLHGQSPWLNAIRVVIRPGVDWDGDAGSPWLRPTRRLMYPLSLRDTAGVFRLDEDGITTLDDFYLVPW